MYEASKTPRSGCSRMAAGGRSETFASGRYAAPPGSKAGDYKMPSHQHANPLK